jgi:hypothetical protein
MSNGPKKKSKTIPGYDKGGRKGQITITDSFYPGKEKPKKGLKQARKDAISKQYVPKDISQSDYNKLAKSHKDYGTSGKSTPGYSSREKSFKPDVVTTPGSPAKKGTKVDTFSAPEKREALRTTKIARRGEIQRGRKAARSARKMQRHIKKHGETVFKQSEVDKQKATATRLKKGGGAIAQSQYKNAPEYTASDVTQGTSFNRR